MIDQPIKLHTDFAPAERATEETLQKQSKYFHNLQFVDSLFSAIPDGVLILNQYRQIVYANAVLCKLLGVGDDKQLIGLRPGEAFGCQRAFETEGGCGTTVFCSTCGAVKSILQAQKGHQSVEECRISTRDENNEIHALDFRVMATPHLFENELFTIFSLVNIGDEKRRRIFERIFFHDITNTAGAIHGLAEIMVETSSLEESEQHELTELLSSASNQLMDEIQGQQQLMAAENGELLIEPKHFNTKRFIQSLIQIYKNHPVAENKDMGIDPNLANVLIMSDQAILGRVIGNMIKNALEACAPQEVVTIGCYKIDDQVRFWVHNAKYIPEQIQLQIFQRSFSTKGTGRGLGTYSMKLLSENYLNGRVSFVSTEVNGTTFMGTFPLMWQDA